MGKYNGAVITAAGQNLIAQAIAESKTVTFTTAQASSHVYPSSTDFEALTALTDVEKTVDINYAGVYSDTVVQVSARFDNDGVETAYLINTLGFFAQLGSDTPILFAVSTAVTPDQMPVFDADNPSAFIYNMQMTVQNADSINLSVNPAGTVTVNQLNAAVSALQTQINAKVNLSGIIDNLNETSAISGDVLSAHQGNVIAKMIAPIEANLTSASQDYAIDEQFIYNGLLYKATAAIAQSSTIVIHGNVELADCVTEQIEYKHLTVDIPTYGGTLDIKKQGKVICLSLTEIGKTQQIPQSTSGTLIYILPIDYRPTDTILSVGTVSKGIGGSLLRCQVLSNGYVYLVSTEAPITSSRLTVNYITR